MKKILLLIPVFLVLEVISLVMAGKFLGWYTLAWLVIDVIIGFVLIQLQGGRVLEALLHSFATKTGEEPASLVFYSLSGALFIFPGFVSDILAILLLLPSVQEYYLKKASAKFKSAAGGSVKFVHFWNNGRERGAEFAEVNRDGVIEGEFREVSPDENSRKTAITIDSDNNSKIPK